MPENKNNLLILPFLNRITSSLSLVEVFTLALVITGIAFTILYYFLLQAPTAALGIAGCTVLASLLIPMNRIFKAPRFWSHLLCFYYFAAISLATYFGGGQVSPAAFWLLSVPILANFVMGNRESIIWFFFSLTSYILLLLFPSSTYLASNFTPWRYYLLMAISHSVCGGLILLAIVYQRTRIELLLEREIKETKKEGLNNQKDSLIQLAHNMVNPLTRCILLCKAVLKKKKVNLNLKEIQEIHNSCEEASRGVRELIKETENAFKNLEK